MINYIYLHGFASSPKSAKAQYISSHFQSAQIPLIIPDLNQNNFCQLTLTRQLQQVSSLFSHSPTPTRLIGSSLGGLTAAILGQQFSQVERLVLLAPAFGFLELWLSYLGEDQLKQWQDTNSLLVYHYGEQRSLPIHYQFVEDVKQYSLDSLTRPIPTLILHGQQDEVIPIEFSRDYASKRPWVKLIELESDHSLTNVLPDIWSEIQKFLQLNRD
ncbi:protein of unknown function UPF0227 [Gloeothece citriformis PCC 7424]|uniref:Esterase n=1 Tax=Gloeothece citriformis (strain PCC 7424) TaxID=65393 RepID=B7K7Q5_GLOC7|nr:YqiA/YcfP family alpha/beta fold hydrolase [Gloeothece citriformis]ACK69823.1 protein of unknown function UPF0227 [Gloeothece citriformis PCC 7424]